MERYRNVEISIDKIIKIYNIKNYIVKWLPVSITHGFIQEKIIENF